MFTRFVSFPELSVSEREGESEEYYPSLKLARPAEN